MMCKQAKKPQPKRISKARFNNRYVRSDKGHRAEVAGASEESLQGTNAGVTHMPDMTGGGE